MNLELQGKHAMVTAGTAGIGLAIVKSFLESGMKVSFFGRDAERLLQATTAAREILAERGLDQDNFLAAQADVSSLTAIRDFYDEAIGRFGPVEVLVNNHGGPPAGKLNDVTDDAFMAAFHSILEANFQLCRWVVPDMKKVAWGRIINILSLSAKESMPNMTLSNVFRPAVIGLAKSMAIELAGNGITVNSILPAAARTDRTMFFVNQRVQNEGKTAEEILAGIAATLPIGRLAESEEFAEVATFLCSKGASYITGNVISLDGGLSKTIF
jgi:3-oxoacyl-[acyl-carrier protein] reductase